MREQRGADSSAGTGTATYLRHLSGSVLVWIAIGGYLLVVKLLLVFVFPAAFADPSQAALFGWIPLGSIWLLGLAGVLLSERTGFPDAWSRDISNAKRILLPVVLGGAWALVPIGIDRWSGYTKLIAANHGLAQQYTGFFPTLFGFSSGAIIVEVVYRLLIIPVVLWLGSTLLLKRRFQEPMFWVLALLTSTLEPIGSLGDFRVLPLLVVVLVGSNLFLFNLTQAAFFRRYGLLAAILLRVGFYFVWHTLYIH